MKFRMIHENYNVADLDKALAFYKDALGLTEKRRYEEPAHTIVFVGNDDATFEMELTALKDHPQPYDLGEGEYNVAFKTKDYAASLARHKEMGVVCLENDVDGVYFIEDPDGYWLEVAPNGETDSYHFLHVAMNVVDIEKTVAFYEEALGLHVDKRIDNDAAHVALMKDDFSDLILELVQLTDHPQPYDLGECEFHLAFETDDFDAAYEKHKAMGCICFENKEAGCYFLEDPDGYWLELGPLVNQNA